MGKAKRKQNKRKQVGGPVAVPQQGGISLSEIAGIFGRADSIEFDFDDPAMAARFGFDEFIGLSDLTAPTPAAGQPRCSCCGTDKDVRPH